MVACLRRPKHPTFDVSELRVNTVLQESKGQTKEDLRVEKKAKSIKDIKVTEMQKKYSI